MLRIDAIDRLALTVQLELISKIHGKAKTKAAAPATRIEPEANGRTAVPDGAEPVTTPNHPVRPIPVLAPFPHIAVNVINAPEVRFLSTNGVCPFSRITLVPCIFPECRFIIPKTKLRLAPSPAHILPFGLCRQSVLFRPLSLIQPVDKLLYLVPRYTFHRPFIPAPVEMR